MREGARVFEVLGMSQPRRITVVRYFTPDGERCRRDAPGAMAKRQKTECYYGCVDGKRVSLSPDLSVSRQMLKKLNGDASLRRVGLIAPFEAHAATPLADHLSDFQAALETKGNSPAYVALAISRLQVVVAGCEWAVL